MNIAIVGTGYVGLVTGTCFADMGNNVYCVDINQKKIDSLRGGIIPIYEPGLSDMVVRNSLAGRLHFVTDLKDCLDDVEVVFIAVGTPPDEDGSADLKYVLAVARSFAENLHKKTLIVTKSTVPVGTSEKVRLAIKSRLTELGKDIEFTVASNPEFLKEGTAVKDFMNPDRVVVGVDSEYAQDIMARLYKPVSINNPSKVIFMDIPSAEMTKYAANSMLATRISFMNEMASVCDRVGANIENVRKGIGSDTRIGSKFLYAGCGYGGSCFPKDVKALIKTGQEKGCSMTLLNAVERVNEMQKHFLANKVICNFRDSNHTIAVLGLSFKPETDDMREATSLVTIESLTRYGFTVKVYDPIAMDECRRRIGDKVIYCTDMYDTIKDADAMILITEWKEFMMPDWDKVKELMKGNLILDGRNIYDRNFLETKGFEYIGIGK